MIVWPFQTKELNKDFHAELIILWGGPLRTNGWRIYAKPLWIFGRSALYAYKKHRHKWMPVLYALSKKHKLTGNVKEVVVGWKCTKCGILSF